MNYLIEMRIAPAATVPTPEQGIAFTERFVLPTLEACERHVANGRILAGGPVLGALAFAFIATADSAGALEELVAGLPIWPRAQTQITPLGAFADRRATVLHRLAAGRTDAAREANAQPAASEELTRRS